MVLPFVVGACGKACGRRVWGSAAAVAATGWRRMCSASSQAPALPPVDECQFDMRFVVNHPDIVVHSLRERGFTEEQLQVVDRVRELATTRGQLVHRTNELLHAKNVLSTEIAALVREGKLEDAEAKRKNEAETVKQHGALLKTQLEHTDHQARDVFAALPNLLDPRVPHGKGEQDNHVVAEWGTDKRKLGEGHRWHDDIGALLQGYDNEAANRVSGTRFAVLRGVVARLHRALTAFMLDMHSTQHGYTETDVPLVVSDSTLFGTGQLPKFEDDLFATNHDVHGQRAFLIPTGEVPLVGMHRGLVLDPKSLPVRVVANSACFRAEAGSYGRDTRGLTRQHQFYKVELVAISLPSESDALHQEMVGHCEAVLRALELPYRKMLLCSADTGFSARSTYDLEVWLPAQQRYREISSISNCGDFQARRIDLKARVKLGKKMGNVHCHTLNGSGLAVGRTLMAVLENHQNQDGSVNIPAALQPYMGCSKLEVPQPSA